MSQPPRVLLIPEDRAVPACPVVAAQALGTRSPRKALALAAIANLLQQTAAQAVLEAQG